MDISRELEALAQQHRTLLKKLSDRATDIRALLVVEVRLDGSWFVTTVNAPIHEEIGMAGLASQNAKDKFSDLRRQGPPKAPDPNSIQ
ncbi:MAG: hypothetical protein JWO48_1200 [Bryobacterales bacterium]|nr:hypothetical protein [Bryobacterales bacterium]